MRGGEGTGRPTDEEKERGLSVSPESSELEGPDSGHLPVGCKSRCPHKFKDLKFLEILGILQQAWVLVSRATFFLLFSA